jgi:hypothetical protein
LSRMGFGPNFLRWFDILYRDPVYYMNLNGHLSGPVCPTTGVKQGDPLSPSSSYWLWNPSRPFSGNTMSVELHVAHCEFLQLSLRMIRHCLRHQRDISQRNSTVSTSTAEPPAPELIGPNQRW